MNDAKALYGIWLQQVLGYGSHKAALVASRFGSAQALYEAEEAEWWLSGLFTPKELAKLQQHSLKEAEKILKRCLELGQTVITLEDEEYPARLRAIYNPPAVIFVKGAWPDWNKRVCVAIVGTRQATPYGKNLAFQFGMELARACVTVVSRGALGVDSASHKGALQGGGLTVALLGCGINTPYLAENIDLRYAISQTGALCSEYPPDTPAAGYYFPMRNRIISGLCQGTLVVEAGRKSGSLITANLALEQGRDVFAVPGDVRSVASCGTNELIKSGAKLVTQAADILEEYGLTSVGADTLQPHFKEPGAASGVISVIAQMEPSRIKKKVGPMQTDFEPSEKLALPELLDSLSCEGKLLYGVLTKDAQPVEQLLEKTKLPMGMLLRAVTELELSGLLQALPGRSYQKIR